MPRITWHICTVLFFIVVADAQSQQIDPVKSGQLVYERSVDGDNVLVYRDDDGTRNYAISGTKCGAISEDGRTIALSSSTNPSELEIIDGPNTTLIASIDWGDWYNCNIVFVDNTIVSVVSENEGRLFFDVQGSTLDRIIYEPSSNIPGQLPEWFPNSTNDFLFVSPSGELVLYEKCPEGEISSFDQTCQNIPEFAVFNLEDRLEIAELERPDSFAITGKDDLGSPIGARNVDWSNDSRYIAYIIIPESPFDNFSLQILDTQVTEYIEINTPFNEQIDLSKGLLWSRNGYKLLFWVVGRWGEDGVQDISPNVRHGVIYDLTTNSFTPIDNVYLLDNAVNSPARWSPSSSQFVFIDIAGELILVDSSTGASNLLDSNVTRVVNW